jgi:hypothetical protein
LFKEGVFRWTRPRNSTSHGSFEGPTSTADSTLKQTSRRAA